MSKALEVLEKIHGNYGTGVMRYELEEAIAELRAQELKQNIYMETTGLKIIIEHLKGVVEYFEHREDTDEKNGGVATFFSTREIQHIKKAIPELSKLHSISKFTQMFSDERHRQITEEGWTPEHDDEHVNGELSDAAACYAATENIYFPKKIFFIFTRFIPLFPWNKYAWYKKQKHDRKRQLIIAGALLIAELERLERVEKNKKENL